MPLVDLGEKRDGSWYADRPSTDDRRIELERLAVAVEKAIGSCRGGGGFAAVVRDQLVALRIVEQHECAAADSRRLRFDEYQHELHGDRRIDGAAPLQQHRIAGIHCERI